MPMKVYCHIHSEPVTREEYWAMDYLITQRVYSMYNIFGSAREFINNHPLEMAAAIAILKERGEI